ncbi:glycosyltransferase family 1 protein [Adlercreutzia sp. ZJ138]|uniref:glycosyltransferase family 1 protein n=1 Tax=Adlercreutzia sp. ZJ138 TaxID=2709405 RepID=UPI00210702F9|nr:glycosyltransferase family 1 protein [Adlercreutzia sp. ZJ138]
MDRGGLETFIMNMYRQINREKVQFDFLCHRQGEHDYDEEIRSLGGRIYRISRCNPLSLRYLKELDTFFSKHHYKVVHSHINCMSSLPLAVARRYGAAVRIAHSHSSRQDKDLKYPIKLMCKRFIRHNATDLFACGVEAGKWMFGTSNFKVIRNAVDVSSYAFDKSVRSRVRDELEIESNALVIGHVGRFETVKNHAFIISVFATILDACPSAVLVLVGDGALRNNIEKQTISLGIFNSARFLGIRSDVSDLLQAMDCFLMPSIYEGLPLVLVEAQATGLPCLVSDSIPEDCDLGGKLVHRVSLREDVSLWAGRIMAISNVGNDRSRGVSIVRQAGFDAHDVSARLQEFYMLAAEESNEY